MESAFTSLDDDGSLCTDADVGYGRQTCQGQVQSLVSWLLNEYSRIVFKMEALRKEYLLMCQKFEKLKKLTRINLDLLFLSINEEENPEARVELNKVKELVQTLKENTESCKDQTRIIENSEHENSKLSPTDARSLDHYLDKMVLIFTEGEVMDSWKRFINRYYNKKVARDPFPRRSCPTPEEGDDNRTAEDDRNELNGSSGQDGEEEDDMNSDVVQGISDKEELVEVNGTADSNFKEAKTDRWSLITQDANIGSPPHFSDFDSCNEEDPLPIVSSNKNKMKHKNKKSVKSMKQKAKPCVMSEDEKNTKKHRFSTKVLLAEFGLSTTLSNLDANSRDRIPCPVCGKEYTWKQRFLAHLKFHKREKDGIKIEPKAEPQLCTICGKTMKNRASLSQHYQRHEILDKGEYIKCRICSKEFLGKHRLQNHMTRKHTLRKFMCEVCGKAYKNKEMMKIHIKSVHLKAKEVCSVCGKEFSSKTNVARHMRIHRGDLPFPCSFCGKRFRASDNRKYHEKRHTGNFPYKCSLCDHVGFISPCNLREHEKKFHSTEAVREPGDANKLEKMRRRKPRLANIQLQEAKILNPSHRCETCGKEFSNYANLRRHSFLHSGVKPHKCSACDRLFSTSDTLKAHMWTHSTEKQFPCNICDKGFNDKRNFMSHMKRVHPEHSTAAKLPYRQPPATVTTTNAGEVQPDYLSLDFINSNLPNQHNIPV